MKAVVYGSTGLVGSLLLSYLTESSDFQEIILFSRKPVSVSSDKVIQIIDEFENLFRYKKQVQADHIFCCTGTTKKKTPDQELYYKIDHDYPLEAAKLGIANGSKHFHLISAVGANPNSTIFYNRTKGKLEEELLTLPFESIHIYRPSLLVGPRKEKRMIERIAVSIMKIIDPLLVGRLKNYRSIKADDIAKAMYINSLKYKKGYYIYTSNQIKLIS